MLASLILLAKVSTLIRPALSYVNTKMYVPLMDPSQIHSPEKVCRHGQSGCDFRATSFCSLVEADLVMCGYLCEPLLLPRLEVEGRYQLLGTLASNLQKAKTIY